MVLAVMARVRHPLIRAVHTGLVLPHLTGKVATVDLRRLRILLDMGDHTHLQTPGLEGHHPPQILDLEYHRLLRIVGSVDHHQLPTLELEDHRNPQTLGSVGHQRHLIPDLEDHRTPQTLDMMDSRNIRRPLDLVAHLSPLHLAQVSNQMETAHRLVCQVVHLTVEALHSASLMTSHQTVYHHNQAISSHKALVLLPVPHLVSLHIDQSLLAEHKVEVIVACLVPSELLPCPRIKDDKILEDRIFLLSDLSSVSPSRSCSSVMALPSQV